MTAAGWDGYVECLLKSAECIKKGAIIGSGDGGVWAKSSDFNASTDELGKLAQQFTNYQDIPQTGIVLEGVKFIVPRCEENIIFGKKMKSGVFVVKTNSAIIIAIFEEGDSGQAGVATRGTVEKLAQYLRDSGF